MDGVFPSVKKGIITKTPYKDVFGVMVDNNPKLIYVHEDWLFNDMHDLLDKLRNSINEDTLNIDNCIYDW